MKKLLLPLVAVLGVVSASAQTTLPVVSKVSDGVYGITKPVEELAADIAAAVAAGAGVQDLTGGNAYVDAGVVYYDDEDITIASGVTNSLVATTWGQNSGQWQALGYTGILNLGSTLDNFEITNAPTIKNVQDIYAGNQGVVKVTPKKNGTLGFKVFSSNKKRTIGIYILPTEAEIAAGVKMAADAEANDALSEAEYNEIIAKAEALQYGKFVNVLQFQNEDKSEAVISAEVFAGREYLFIGGQKGNQACFEITLSTQTVTTTLPVVSKVSTGVYGITKPVEELAADIAAAVAAGPDVQDLSGGNAYANAGVVYYDDEDITIASGVTNSLVATTWGQNAGQWQALGSTLDNFELADAPTIKNVQDIYAGNQGVIKVTVKDYGVLGFKVFSSSKKRTIGIYILPTEAEIAAGAKMASEAENNDALTEEEYNAIIAEADALQYGKFVNVLQFQHEDKAEAVITTDAEIGRSYLFIGGQKGNQACYEINFNAISGEESGIESIGAEIQQPQSDVMYNIFGQRVDESYKGIIIKNGKKYLNR